MPGPPKKEGVPPAGNGDTPLDFIALGIGDGSDNSLSLDRAQLCPRPIGPGEIGVIVLTGDRS